MRWPRLSRTCATEVGRAGMPSNPYTHSRTTSTIKTAFHLSDEFMICVSAVPRGASGSGGLALRLSLLLFDIRLHAGDGRARDLHFHLIGNPNLHRIVFKPNNGSVNP